MAISSTKPLPMTADDLLKLRSDGVRAELVRGVLSETMPPGLIHAEIVYRLSGLLWDYLKSNNVGRVFTGDSGIWIGRDPDTVRAPDIAFYAADRLPQEINIPGFAEIVPDLVIEVVSPNDAVDQVYDKARMWVSQGVMLVWVV